ncbi:hypothetical protein FPQ18DRAFT_307371 [Pyronema domesticum]|nr:hypothetical protein FPQ18DRAFT_307371 [Pyronema domesticum]
MIYLWATELSLFVGRELKFRAECNTCEKKGPKSTIFDLNPGDQVWKRAWKYFIRFCDQKEEAFDNMRKRKDGKWQFTCAGLFFRVEGAGYIVFAIEYLITTTNEIEMPPESTITSAGQLIPLLIGGFSAIWTIASVSVNQYSKHISKTQSEDTAKTPAATQTSSDSLKITSIVSEKEMGSSA